MSGDDLDEEAVLVARWLAGEASAIEREQLRERLRADPTLLRRIYREARFELFLQSSLSTRDPTGVQKLALVGQRPGRHRGRRRSGRRSGRRSPVAAALALVLFIGAGLVGGWLLMRPDQATATTITTQDERRVLALNDGSRLQLAPSSRLAVAQATAAVTLELAGGGLRCQVARAGPERRFIARSPHLQATIHGTIFELHSDQASLLFLQEGRLSLQAGPMQYQLQAGDLVLADAAVQERWPVLCYQDFASAVRTPTGIHCGAVTWRVSGGVVVRPDGIGFDGAQAMLHNDELGARIAVGAKASQAISLLAWVTPQGRGQTGPARIVGLADDKLHADVLLMQGGNPWQEGYADRFGARLRHSGHDDAKGERHSLHAAQAATPGRRVLVALTLSAPGASRLFVDGDLVDDKPVTGDLSGWATDFPLVLGNDPVHDRPWVGILHRLVVIDRALTPTQIGCFAGLP